MIALTNSKQVCITTQSEMSYEIKIKAKIIQYIELHIAVTAEVKGCIAVQLVNNTAYLDYSFALGC